MEPVDALIAAAAAPAAVVEAVGRSSRQSRSPAARRRRPLQATAEVTITMVQRPRRRSRPGCRPSAPATPRHRVPRRARRPRRRASVKVDTRKLDNLVDMVGELVIAQSLISRGPGAQRRRRRAAARATWRSCGASPPTCSATRWRCAWCRSARRSRRWRASCAT